MNIILIGILIPFLGTILGSALVFFIGKKINSKLEKLLLGFAAGVMFAASIWSLIIPSMEMSSKLGNLMFIPAVVGFLIGMIFLLCLDMLMERISFKNISNDNNLRKNIMLLLAVTMHNLPEGMTIGVVLAGFLYGNKIISLIGILTLSIGIAIQNIPEGAIVSSTLKSKGEKSFKSFLLGILSGIVEPIGAIITLLFSELALPILPYLLSFAAGAMIYVVVEELIPESQEGKYSNIGIIGVALGFALMLVLDVALG